MNRLPRMRLAIAAAVLATAAVAPASADTLLIDRTQTAAIQMPARGVSMAQVESQFGAPASKLEPRGGQKRQWPTIHRWVYPAFTVYFENSRVIDTVVNQATASETGPKPAIR